MKSIKECWSASKAYRVLLIAAVVYAVLRLAMQIYLFDSALQPEAIAQGQQVSADLQLSYIPAAQHFKAHQDIYLKGSLAILEYQFPYSPAFAFLFMPILLLPINILVPLLVVLHIAAYILLYIWWNRILEKSILHNVAIAWAKMLPLFLVFTVFWDDLAYMNIYLIVALFSTIAIDAVLQENLAWASFWLGAVILPIKPHWAFVLALPLLLGRYKFFLKLLLGTVVAYLAVAGITILAGGIGYGLQQYQDYFAFITRLSRDFPWRGPDRPFLGYNHSIIQIVMYYFGVSSTNMRIATIVKLLLLVPLGLIALKFSRHPVDKPGYAVPETALPLTFALYLGAFIWLDMVWELSLALVIFAYLLATVEEKGTQTFLWILFAPYALLDIWRLVSFIVGGENILYEGSYVLTDPLIYVPWIMILLLVFYGLLLQRLNRYAFAPVYKEVPQV